MNPFGRIRCSKRETDDRDRRFTTYVEATNASPEAATTGHVQSFSGKLQPNTPLAPLPSTT